MQIKSAKDIARMLPNTKSNVLGIPGLRVDNRSGHAYYVYRRMVNGRNYEVSLKTNSFDKAKAKATALKLMDKEDFLDSIRQVKDEKLIDRTFESVANAYTDWRVEVGDWEKDGKAHKDMSGYLNNHILPVFKKMVLNEITPSVVAKIASRSNETPYAADRSIDVVRTVFDWAKAKGWYAKDNPADKSGALKFLLPRQKDNSFNFGAIPLERVPEFCRVLWETCDARDLLFLFSILTATRSGTVRLVSWEDIDLDKHVWHVKQETLKVKKNHYLDIPLSSAAMAVLEMAMGETNTGSVFVSPKGRYYSDAVFSQRIAQLNETAKEPWLDEAQTKERGEPIKATQHGIARACFKTWATDDSNGNDQKYSSKVSEICLHHSVKDAYNGAYERGEYFKRRAEMMQAWGEFCFSAIARYKNRSKKP